MSLQEDFENHEIKVNPQTSQLKDYNGKYDNPYIRARWVGYQAATDRAVRIVESFEFNISKQAYEAIIAAIKGEL